MDMSTRNNILVVIVVVVLYIGCSGDGDNNWMLGGAQKMNIVVVRNTPEYDHDVVYGDELRIGIVRHVDNKIYLQKCPVCKLENWACAVAGGTCAWCGWDARPDWELYMRESCQNQ